MTARFALLALLFIGLSGFTCGPAKTTPPGGATAPSITTQPASVTVTQNQDATFSVTAAGTAPLTYQWQKNGTPIAGATSASYTAPSVALADSGASFKVVVSNAKGSVTSSSATLTVNVGVITGHPGSITVHAAQADGGMSSPFVAFQDGNGPWQSVTHQASGTYTFNVTDSNGRYGVVVADPSLQAAAVLDSFYATVDEVPEVTLPRTIQELTPHIDLDVSASNIDTGSVGKIWLGNRYTQVQPGLLHGLNPALVTLGTYDGIIAIQGSSNADPIYYEFQDDIVIGDDIPSPVEFNTSVTYTAPSNNVHVTVENGPANTPIAVSGGVSLRAGNTQFDYQMPPQGTGTTNASGTGTASLSIYPHGVMWAAAGRGDADYAQVYTTKYFSAVADQTLPLGSVTKLSAASVDTTPYLRPKITWAAGSSALVFDLQMRANATSAVCYWYANATRGWAETGDRTLQFPDLSGVSGWEAIKGNFIWTTGQSAIYVVNGYSLNNDVHQSLGDAMGRAAARNDGDVLNTWFLTLAGTGDSLTF